MRNIIIAILLFSLTSNAQDKAKFPNITLVNSITYNDTSFTENHPGCGFLIDIGDEILAVTCKHVLWENKPLNISSVDINDQITSWKMFIRNDKSQYVILDKLINNNPKEKIGEWNTDKDFLVFTVKKNHSNIKPLKLASARAQKGDTIYKVGWAFKDNNVPQQIYKSSVFKYSGPSILIQDFVRSNQAGTSGSPVINKNQELLGIVSSWKYDNETKAWYGAPCSTDYLWEVIYDYWLQKNNMQKNYASFNLFISYYNKKNSTAAIPSDNLITNLFFDNNICTRADYDAFKKEAEKELNIKLNEDLYLTNNLIFNEWKSNYLMNKSDIENLKKIAEKENNFYYDFMMLSMFGLELIDSNNLEKALELMLFTQDEFPNNGQVYAFLADVYSAKGNKENAKINYEKCLKFYPGYPYAKDKLRNL